MLIDCISDLHGYQPQLSGGDLLIIAGDLTARDMATEHAKYCHWQYDQMYEKIIFIAGNHDGYIEKRPDLYIDGCDNKGKIAYLQDSGIEYKGLKIWGSPWTPTFYDWHFMKDRGKAIQEKWDLIPEDIDILITHGPPYGILDKVKYPNDQGDFAGCEELRKAIERIQPRLHVFGHIHEGYGQMTLKCASRDVIFVNASIMNEAYRPVNKPITIKLDL